MRWLIDFVCLYLVILKINQILSAEGKASKIAVRCYKNGKVSDCNIADTQNYNRSTIKKSCPGFGTEWVLFPDGEEIPRVVYLKKPADLNARIFDIPDMQENVRFILYTR